MAKNTKSFHNVPKGGGAGTGGPKPPEPAKPDSAGAAPISGVVGASAGDELPVPETLSPVSETPSPAPDSADAVRTDLSDLPTVPELAPPAQKAAPAAGETQADMPERAADPKAYWNRFVGRVKETFAASGDDESAKQPRAPKEKRSGDAGSGWPPAPAKIDDAAQTDTSEWASGSKTHWNRFVGKVKETFAASDEDGSAVSPRAPKEDRPARNKPVRPEAPEPGGDIGSILPESGKERPGQAKPARFDTPETDIASKSTPPESKKDRPGQAKPVRFEVDASDEYAGPYPSDFAPPGQEMTADEALRARYYQHLDKLFHAVKNSGRLNDLKDEFVDAMVERYYGALYRGEPPEQAYKTGIHSVGRVSEIIRNLRHDEELDYRKVRRTKAVYAAGVALGVALFIISAIVYMLINGRYPVGSPVPIAWLVGIAGAGVCVLVFFVIAIPRYIRFDDTIVEDFKEWRSATSARMRTQRALSALLWSATVAVYLVLSFWLAAWAYTWILFLICFALDRAVAAFLSLKN